MWFAPLGTSFYLDFIVSDPTTGAAVDADSDPTITVFENDTDAAISVGVAVKRLDQTGHYYALIEATTANGYEKGKSYNVSAAFNVSAVALKLIVSSFIIDAAMEKLTNVAALLNVAAPPSFEPVVDAFEEEEPTPLVDQFGYNSDHEHRDLFTEYWDGEKGQWMEGAELAVPADFMAEVSAAQLNISNYEAGLATWQAGYELQKEVQWRKTYAAALIAETE